MIAHNLWVPPPSSTGQILPRPRNGARHQRNPLLHMRRHLPLHPHPASVPWLLRQNRARWADRVKVPHRPLLRHAVAHLRGRLLAESLRPHRNSVLIPSGTDGARNHQKALASRPRRLLYGRDDSETLFVDGTRRPFVLIRFPFLTKYHTDTRTHARESQSRVARLCANHYTFVIFLVSSTS